jgi:hypothetical protein
MKKLMLVVAVAISTAVSAQKAPRKVIIETTGYQVLRSGVNIIDSAWVEYTRCQKEAFAGFGADTTNDEDYRFHWEYNFEYYNDSLETFNVKERYVFNMRTGVIKYSNSQDCKRVKSQAVTISAVYGSIFNSYSIDANEEFVSYSIYPHTDTFIHYLKIDVFTATPIIQKSFTGVKITTK